MLNRLVNFIFRGGVAILLLSCSLSAVYAAKTPNDALQFNIVLVEGADRYLELLEHPAYLVVAMENNGIKPSNMGSVTLVDERTIQFKNAMLQYLGKSNSVYTYKSSLEWDTPFKHLKLDVPVEIDSSSISKGNIQVSVFLPLADFFPDALVERIKMKIQILSEAEVQKRMLGYFDGLSNNSSSVPELHGLFTKILLSNINLRSCVVPADSPVGTSASLEPGDAELLSDQTYLLATLAIWLIIGPALIAAFIVWRNYKNRKINRLNSGS
ncbi:MAG: hypothetical protein H8D34_23445 [Chloroflexi bacterium]|nr:hypothetical protein [Chloroflexota bacterium]